MNALSRPRVIAGWILLVLVAGMMIFAGSGKVFGLMPPEAKAEMAQQGLDENKILLIGAGELIAAILLLIPRTFSLGFLLTTAFWGGAICFHLVRSEPYWMQSGFLLLTWLGAWLRYPATFHSLYPTA